MSTLTHSAEVKTLGVSGNGQLGPKLEASSDVQTPTTVNHNAY